ncbi:MAG: YlaI family protein [Kurthia sp.]|nr:YlaI family protein [Candidatus Kurthia equi]
MKVRCVICETINDIPDFSSLAKKLRNRPIHTYMCEPCNERIAEKTEARLATGNFHFYKGHNADEEEF